MTATYNVDNFKDIFEHEFTYLNGFMRNTGRFGNNPAMYDSASGKRWTYRELNEDANRLANVMLQDGLTRGGVVMYMLFNSPEFVFCYIGGHKAAAIGCPINFRLSAGEIALLIDDSKPEFFVYHQEFAPVARQALKMATHKPKRVLIAGENTNPEDGEMDFAEYMSAGSTDNPQLPFRPHIYDETTRLYTSGTTNTAKAVPLNSINEVLSAHDVMMHFPLNNTDRTMNMTPWFHRGGLHSGGVCPTLYAGGELIILREFNPRRCLQLVEKEKVTFLTGVPSLIAILARLQKSTPFDLSSLRGIVTMGSPFEKGACIEYMELFTPNIFNGYGTTETFWNTFLRPYNLPDMAGSAGRSCTDDDVRIVKIRKDGSHAEPDDLVAKDNNEIGEVIIKSPAKSAGCYANNPQMSAEKFYKGYHYTGDLGKWDEGEFITICGRKDDMIICAGENIYPPQIEGILNEHPKVAECAIIGEAEQKRGQVVAAYIVPADPDLTVDELKEYCASHPMLSTFKRPKVYYFVEELPHTATGKIMHYKIREKNRKN